ncbi:MAG TPA: hypothetical protein VN578_03665 [Candidatus Binatia bacterium]|jgi:hypothetical protein|nr:hypothetical protein [Candidatus Binatia bacterium]
MVVVLAAIILLFLVSARPNEPSYAGKTLTQWLLNTNADGFWIPNDVYGHIHDELWSVVSGPDSETNLTGPVSWQPVPVPDEVFMAVRHIGTNGIPRLIQLISSRPGPWATIRGAIAARLPQKWGGSFYPYDSRFFAQQLNVAAFEGFTILGTNAEPALSALSNLLFQGRDQLQLTWAMANIGPKGMAVLTNALALTNDSLRDAAALALGLKYQQARLAVPALVDSVERGDATYDVLGALGRIGCDDPRLVPALVRLLEAKGAPANPKVNTGMAFLLLGLQREKARVAAPLVIAEYRLVEGDAMAAAERGFYRRILMVIAPDLETQLPPRPPDEKSGLWP